VSTFYERLKYLRKENGLTQDNLAEALNVTKGTVSVWERGVRKPDIKTLEEICKYFEVTMGYLLAIHDVRNEEGYDELEESPADQQELEDITAMLKRLSRSTRRIVKSTIKAAFDLDEENGQLKPKD